MKSAFIVCAPFAAPDCKSASLGADAFTFVRRAVRKAAPFVPQCFCSAYLFVLQDSL